MRKNLLFLILILSVSSIRSQYEVKSQYILTPDLNIDYVRKNAEFWIQAYDSISGHSGFYSSIKRDGTRRDNEKSFIVQSRQGYAFTRTFMMTGDERYLRYAKIALDFLYDHGWDKVNGGWYCFGNQDGSLILGGGWAPDASVKWSFQQHYGMLGPVAHYEATRDARSKEYMEKGINTLYTKLWDSRPYYEGYYANTNVNWSNPRGKGFTPTVDAITTHAELLYLVTQDETHKNRLIQLGDNITDYFIKYIDENPDNILYPGEYSSNWGVTAGSSSIGHYIKTAWCLARVYLVEPNNPLYKQGAIKILDKSWNFQNGLATVWDHVNGGPYEAINMNGTQTAAQRRKDYWTVEQGFTGPMINYYITQNPIYLKMADQSLDFFMNHFVDEELGGTYWTLAADGALLNDQKGDRFEGNYHASELGYYAYLYSNLYYLYRPVHLFYMFEPVDYERNITLTPLPTYNNSLTISAVELNGEAFNTFNSPSRTLNIPANMGGKFKVTFQNQPPQTGVESVNQVMVNVYPNPVVNQINIKGDAMLNDVIITDLSGKAIYQSLGINSQSYTIDFSTTTSGVYLVILSYDNERVVKKIVKQ